MFPGEILPPFRPLIYYQEFNHLGFFQNCTNVCHVTFVSVFHATIFESQSKIRSTCLYMILISLFIKPDGKPLLGNNNGGKFCGLVNTQVWHVGILIHFHNRKFVSISKIFQNNFEIDFQPKSLQDHKDYPPLRLGFRRAYF